MVIFCEKRTMNKIVSTTVSIATNKQMKIKKKRRNNVCFFLDFVI
jgi:hypothetical protein